MAQKITPFLMFDGVADEAMNFYVSLFGNAGITQIEHYSPGEPGAEETVKRASFTLAGRQLIAIDSPVKHGFTFTPSISLFVDCYSKARAGSGVPAACGRRRSTDATRQLRIQ